MTSKGYNSFKNDINYIYNKYMFVISFTNNSSFTNYSNIINIMIYLLYIIS